MNMNPMNQQTNKLPQEGTNYAGAPLLEQSSDCLKNSGEGKILPPQEALEVEKKKTLTQQLFHTSMFHRTRSSSTSDIQAKPQPTIETEMDWVQVANKKRQRSSPESLRSQKQSKLNTYWLSQPSQTPTSNNFALLEDEGDQQLNTDNTTKINTPNKPPPIFVDRVSNIQPLIDLLEAHALDKYELKILRNEQVKIQSKTSEIYTTIVKELGKKETEFYTYKPKQDRSFKTVLKHMHPSTNINEIKEALAELDHECTNVWNIKQHTTKKALPMFIVDMKQKDNNKSIYDIKYLLHCKVTFEPPRPKREIPQCGRCLQYGHTKAYCRRGPKCVKYAGDHLTADCSRKNRSDKVKCILCDGNHPANYKGCKVYRELQKIKFAPQPERFKRPLRIENTKQIKDMTSTTGLTYAEIAKNTIEKQQAEKPKTNISNESNNDMRELMTLMKQMMQQLTTMTNLILQLTSKLTPNWIP